MAFPELSRFQYRKRYEITCDYVVIEDERDEEHGFNTASGMRSHVTVKRFNAAFQGIVFQYRKRYEITCDYQSSLVWRSF